MSCVMNNVTPVIVDDKDVLANSGDILQNSDKKKVFLADSAASVSSLQDESSTSDDFSEDDEPEGKKCILIWYSKST